MKGERYAFSCRFAACPRQSASVSANHLWSAFGAYWHRREETADLDSFDRYRLEDRLEALCEKGCRQVWQAIEALEGGEDLPETRGLSAEECRLLLLELKQVMAVYADRCSAL